MKAEDDARSFVQKSFAGEGCHSLMIQTSWTLSDSGPRKYDRPPHCSEATVDVDIQAAGSSINPLERLGLRCRQCTTLSVTTTLELCDPKPTTARRVTHTIETPDD